MNSTSIRILAVMMMLAGPLWGLYNFHTTKVEARRDFLTANAQVRDSFDGREWRSDSHAAIRARDAVSARGRERLQAAKTLAIGVGVLGFAGGAALFYAGRQRSSDTGAGGGV